MTSSTPGMSTSSSNKWGNKLSTKMSVLSESSSKESLQTLAMWIFFNRKHKAEFVETFRESLQQPGTTTSGTSTLLILTVIHEVLMLHCNTEKWDRLADLRLQLGESIMLLFANTFPVARLTSLLTEWDTHNVFGGPTLIHQIRKKISTSSSASTPVAIAACVASHVKAVTAPVPVKEETKIPVPSVETKPKETNTAPATISSDSLAIPLANTSTHAPTKEVHYDFESKGITENDVDIKEFVEPCRSIATLQIARDLRSDNAVQLSFLLQSMPVDVRVFTAAAAENDGAFELEEDKGRDFCMRVSEQLIDTDLAEQLQSARTFRDIVSRQKTARQQLLDLLVQSRCKFEADQAAAAYYSVDGTQLKQRAQILADAMELEGLEVEPYNEAEVEEELPPLSWYKPTGEEHVDDESANKRQKVVE